MDKVKIKNLVVNNKKKLIIALTMLLISILLISIITYATSNQDYVVEVKDDGSENIAKNEESSVTKKIVSETTKSLTYEVVISNLKTRSSNPEVAIVLDTSNSMTINDIETQVKSKAIEFVRGLLTEVKGIKISISNNAAIKANLGTVTTSNYTNIINGIVAGQGSNLSDGIDKAISTFSVADNEKYLVIFSDATDPILEKLQQIKENSLAEVYSILTDMTNNEYTENPDTVGNVQMISDIESFSPIYNKINNSIINVKVKDIFTQETNEYFTLTEGTKDADVTFTKTEDGYELDCANIKAGETKKVQFTLTIDESSNIDAGKIYRALDTSSKMTINYDNYTGDARNYEMEHSPIYMICKKYSLTIKAVSEKSDKLPVQDLDIKVVGKKIKDGEGNEVEPTVVFDEVLKTNNKGEILIDDLKTLGTIEFEIKPIVNQLGYSETSATTIEIKNEPKLQEGLSASCDLTEQPDVNNTTRNVTVKLPIKTQTFSIEIETIDLTNSNIKLGNIDYRLIQPKLNSKYEMEALYDTTVEDGTLTFHPSVMTEDGTYEYILSQLTEQEGYVGVGNVTLYITFKNGEIADQQILGKQYGFTHKYNENVETQRISGTVGKVIVKNESENADTFRLEINVADSNDSNKKLEGAIYDVEATRITTAGNQITSTFKGCITDEKGQIKLDLPGTGNVQVKITEVNPATGYHADNVPTKELAFVRNEGRVQRITNNPQQVEAHADSDANALVVNLKSVERTAKNRVQIHMIDSDEVDVNIPGVGLTLVNLVNNKTYTAVSDGNGIANFLVDDEEPGVYTYDIRLTNGLPYGYTNAENKLGTISVQFADGKLISDCSDISASVPHFETKYELMSEEFKYHTAKVEIGLTPDPASSYNFQVKLIDGQNKALPGAKYDITMEDGNGNVLRKITGRLTDSNGMITTKLIGKDQVTIKVKETETIKGYIINTQEQIIDLTKVNGVYQLTNQDPYKYNGTTQLIGVETPIVGNNVIYHDVNKAKTGNNTVLNIYMNKIDPNNNLIGGVKTMFESETLKLNGAPITAQTKYSTTAPDGSIYTLNPGETDNQGYFEVEGIEVNGASLTNGERVDYLIMYEVDSNGTKVPNTDMEVKLTFRYNENKEIVELTNVEATKGNRLLSKREFSGYESSLAYESNLYLDIYTNYENVGNFSLDLEKTDKNDNKLPGAKYDVIATRLDGTRIVRKGIEVTDSVEFPGFIVAAGTKIEITEAKPPIGYVINEYTEIITIESVDEQTGAMVVNLEQNSYATPRAKLKPLQTIVLDDGTLKTEATLQLIDYEADTFKFGITAIDPINTQTTPDYVPAYIPGYTFSISTSQGAQSETPETDENGKTSTLVGANYKTDNFIVTYKIDTLKAAKYYKRLANPIEVIVVFDLNGEVKGQETRDANAANSATNGYNTTWFIDSINTTDGNDIDIRINIEPEDKLIVNVISQDRRSKVSVTGNQYTITPALNGTGKGSQKIEVGYIVSDSTQTYTIHQDSSNPDYQAIGDQIFKIDYDKDGNVQKVYDPDGGSLGGTANSGRIISETHSGKEITLTIVIDPKITVNIISKDRRTKAIVSNIEYEITPNEMAIIGGVSPISVGYSVQNEDVEYTLKQTNILADYAMLEEQKFTVEYGDNDEIVDVKNTSSGIVNKSFTNGTVTLTVELEPTISVKIISKDRISGNIITTNTYQITPTDSRVDSNSEHTPTTDFVECKVGFAKPGEAVEYTIAQTNNSPDYETLDNQTFKVEYDGDDNIIDVRDESDKIITKSFTNSGVELTLELEPILPVTVNIKSTDMITGKEIYTTQIIDGNTTKIYTMGYSIGLKEYENDGVIIKENTQGQGTTKIKDERFTTGVTENGKNQLTFNCAIPDGEGTYVLKQTNELNNYVKLDDIEFKIEYDHEDNIKNATTDASNLIITSWNERTLDIEVKVEPGVPFSISNIGYFDNLPLSNGQFEITSAKPITKNTTTNNNGEAVAYVDKLGKGNTVRYGIKQTSAKIGYCTTEEFEIEVTYDENRYITNAKLIDGSPVNRHVTLVNVSYTSPSIEGNIGYNDNDRGIVNIEVKNYPAVQFEITNLNRVDGTTKISGTNYKVTSTTNEEAAGITNPTAIVYLGRGAFSNTITYTIEETAPAVRHQAILEDIVIEVDFDEQGKVVDPPRVIKGGQIASATAAGRASYADSLKVNVEIKSNPKLAIAVRKLDEDTMLPVQDVDFEVIAQINKDDLNNYDEEKLSKIMKDTAELTEEQYLEEALYRLKQTKDDIQSLKQTIGIDKIVKDLKNNNNLTAEQENEIMQGISYIQQANIIAGMGKLTITQVNQTVNAVTITEVANKLIEDGVTTQDAINDIISEIKKLVRLDVDRITTDQHGDAVAYLGKTLENKTIEYTLKETKKKEGYDWPDEVVRFEVTYDDTGKMVQSNPIKVVSGNFDIINYDINNMTIDATVKNEPSKEVKIHVVAQDTYDSDKKLEVAKLNAHLIDPNSVDYYGRLTFAPDNKYRTTLATGSVQNGSGTVAHGEDTESLGIYKEGPGTRILRLVANQTPNTYYKNSTAYSASYQGIPYSMLIQVSFNDEGRVTGASLYHPGEDIEHIGTIADGRYIEVTSSMNTIEITVKYYPMVRIQMVTKDMYTNSALQARYTISTNAQCAKDWKIRSGCIDPYDSTPDGRIYKSGYTTSAGLNITSGNADDLYGAYKLAFAPTEAEPSDSRVRRLYIYENQEPTSPMQYQKYKCWNTNTMMDDALIAIIEVKYNEKGEIDRNTPPKIIETRSRTNIQSNFVELKAHISDDYTIQLTVKYAPITTISAKVIDAVSGQGIEGIRIDPYQYNSDVSNNSYEYRSGNKFYITGKNGNTGWTYWGGSIASGKVYYKMSTSNYYSDIYMKSGYFNPGPILLEVLYDENGRVTTAAVKTTDQFGDPNAINISWDSRNHISITIPYQRQFLLNIGKVNYDDSTEKLSASRFRIESSKGVLTEFNGNSGNHVVGKVYPGKTVRYTITETQIPNGYISVGTMYVDVEFNNNGTIRKQTSSEPDYYEFLNEISLENNVCTGMRINIKNKLAFRLKLDVRDEFYPTLGVQGATYEIKNDKGDNAAGTLVTDKNGIIDVVVGTIYKNETVKYTIKQTNKANGYYINSQEIEVTVIFNKGGDINTVSITKGTNVATASKMTTNQDIGIYVRTTNMPEDVKIGIEKTDRITGQPMDGIQFNVKTEPSGKVAKDYTLVTNADGKVVEVVDKFEKTSGYKKVKYTISEIQVPGSYRKIEDVQIEVTYKEDGSMYYYDVLSNPSKLSVQVATNKQIKAVNDMPVHIKLGITNDNAYDLIIKNTDRNFSGLGIEGTVYDVTINGKEVGPLTTDSNGNIRIPNRTESGRIEISITERKPGEGYRAEPMNTVTTIVNKGTDIYSLALDPVDGNNNPTYATITANEAHGTVTVEFKNETKLELNLVKDDINTGKLLEGAIFAITSEELDNKGNAIAGTQKSITNTVLTSITQDSDGNSVKNYNIDEEEATDANGLVSFDLGLAHQNKTIKYTLEEVRAPESYTAIAPIEVTVQFDQYGRIIQMTDNSFRADCYLDSDTGKSHNMIFNVSNGTITPQYSVKVVSTDSQTGIRINDSIFQVEVTDSEGTTFKEVTGKTRDVIKTVGNVTFASERGVMKVTGIKAEGDIKISLNQVETATGYVYGSNKVVGEVLANAQFIPSTTNLDDDLKLTVKPNSGFEVTVDNTNREIIIKVKNDPELTFDITKIDGKTKEKLANAEFTVTSVLQTSATTVPTTLNETSKLTDENGHTTLNGGMIMAGRTMIYTLKENKLEGYEQLDDIILLVQYDTKGKILYYEILSDENDARVINDKEQAKILETKRVLQGNDVQGKVELEAQTYSIPTGIGTRVIQLEVSNKAEVGNENDEYQIVIEKHHIDDELYPYFIPGVVFEITVKQEYGKAETKWIDTTDENGIITSPYFDGYGNITVQIRELETIEGFKLDAAVKTIKFKRDKETHKLELVSLDPRNIGYEFSDDNSKVIMKPVNDVSSDTYNIVLNKMDKNTNLLITDNPAEFEIYRIDKYETLTPVENEETGDITYDSSIQEIKQLVLRQRTDARGRIVANNLPVPDEEGTYRYVITETKAPEGYILPTEDIELDVTFTKNDSEELVITNVVVVKGEKRIKIAQTKDKIMSLIVSNTNGQDVVQDGEYALNILKVDKDKNPITTSAAIFKLTDMKTNEVNYYETNEQGKLEIPAFKMPEEEGKYIYKLNEVKAPNGYILNVNDIMLELEFAKDEEGKMYLKDVQVQGDNIEYEAPEEGSMPDTTITIKVINEEGGSGTGNVNDKRYTLVLNKVDSETKEVITEHVEFEVILANGEIVKGNTNSNGQLRIEDVFMPAQPGEYELVIKEITTPSGYIVDNEPKSVKVTFTGYGDNMVISDIKLGDTNNKNIEILEDKCTDQYIEVNILNEKDNYEKLYVVSKRYQEGYKFYDSYLENKNSQSQIYKDGEEIYQVLDGFYGVEGYKNPHYTIDKPFIDTKIAKYKSYVLAEEFIGNLESNGYMEVLGYDGKPIGPQDHVGTGMTLRSTLGDQELTFTIVVKGDVDYNDGEKTKTQIGRVSTTDLDKLLKHLSKESTITDPIALRAIDLDYDGRIRVTDLDKMYELLGGKVYYNYFQNGIDKSNIVYTKP